VSVGVGTTKVSARYVGDVGWVACCVLALSWLSTESGGSQIYYQGHILILCRNFHITLPLDLLVELVISPACWFQAHAAGERARVSRKASQQKKKSCLAKRLAPMDDS
jgi:hypothetical protein